MFLKIRQERIEKGWTQVFVAQKIGVTKAAYRNIETGQRKPSYDVLIKLLSLFDYDDPRKLFEIVDSDIQNQSDSNFTR